MKKITVFVIAVLLFVLFPVVCSAQETEIEIADEQLELLGVDDLNDQLPNDVQDYLEKYDLLNPVSSVGDVFSADNIFDIISDFFKNNIKTPLKSCLIIIAVILFSAVADNIGVDNKTLQYTVSISVAATALIPAISVITSCAEAIKIASGFMMSFIPILAIVLASKGKPLTSAGFSGVMTVATQIVNYICGFFLIPMSCMQLSIGLSSSVSGDIKTLSVSNAIKKISTWVLTLICTVFLGVLGVQTAINSPADNLYSKTAKFLIGSAVPIVGNVVSEALNTVRGSLQLLGSTVAIYGLMAIVFLMLPLIIELILWRLCMMICCAVAEMLGIAGTASLLKTVETCFAFVLGITVLVMVMFILSLTIVMVA